MARRFAGTQAQHRVDAGTWSKEARETAQKARAAARRGDCGTAVWLLALTNYRAGQAVANRKWAGGRRGKLHAGGSHMGSRMVSLNNGILRACGLHRG